MLRRSRSLILDPLAGHSALDLRVDDADLRETIKELAQLDGGFVISHDGLALSACRYFESSLQPGPQPLGLGTRHQAAAINSGTSVQSPSSFRRVRSSGSTRRAIC